MKKLLPTKATVTMRGKSRVNPKRTTVAALRKAAQVRKLAYSGYKDLLDLL